MIGKKSHQGVPTTDGVNAFIGRKTAFEGKIRFEGMFRVDGKYDGEILSGDSLVVGETAEVNARINVNTLTVHGNLNGNIIAKKRILIYPPGRILGDIQTPALAISEGAIFEGKCHMEKRDKKQNEKGISVKTKGDSTGDIERKKNDAGSGQPVMRDNDDL